MWKIALGLFMTASTALAGTENTSVYSSIDFATCTVLEAPPTNQDFGYGSYLCKGVSGQQVYVLEGDVRNALAFGVKPQRHCAATQSFEFMNDVVVEPMAWRMKHKDNGVNIPKIEWRLKGNKPIATIVRWQVARGYEELTDQRSVLVVTRASDGRIESKVVPKSVWR